MTDVDEVAFEPLSDCSCRDWRSSTAGACFDPERHHRFHLWRRWDDSLPTVGFIMLNPSLADEQSLDPTLRRCFSFAQRWGAGSMRIGNLFSLIEPDSTKLRSANRGDVARRKRQADHLANMVRTCEVVVVGWGTQGSLFPVQRQVLEGMFSMRRELLEADFYPQCLGRNADGTPKHPLYLRGDAKLKPYPVGVR